MPDQSTLYDLLNERKGQWINSNTLADLAGGLPEHHRIHRHIRRLGVLEDIEYMWLNHIEMTAFIEGAPTMRNQQHGFIIRTKEG